MPAVDQGALTSLAMGGGSTLPESQLVPIAMGPPPSHGGIIPARVSSEMMDISDPEPYTHQQQQQHHHQDTVPRPLALEYTTPASSGAIVPGVPPPRQGSMHREYDDQHQHQYSQHHHHSNVNTDRDLPDVPYHSRPTYTPIHHGTHHQQDNNQQQQLQLVASTSSAGVPTGPTFEDLVRVLGVGEPFVSSFEGTSQYSNGGPSACGLASMNSVRQIFMYHSKGIRDGALLRVMHAYSFHEEVINIASFLKDTDHLEINDLHKLPMFGHTMNLLAEEYSTCSFDSFKTILTRLAQESIHGSPVGAVITKSPEIIAVTRIPLPPPQPTQHPDDVPLPHTHVYAVFDSHARPEHHPNGSAYILFPTADQAARYLADLLKVDETLLNSGDLQWQTELLTAFSAHIFTPQHMNSEMGTTPMVSSAWAMLYETSVELVQARGKASRAEMEASDAKRERDNLAASVERLRGELREEKERANRAIANANAARNMNGNGNMNGHASGSGSGGGGGARAGSSMTRQSQREIEYLASYGRDAGGSGSGSGSGSKTTEQMTAEQYARFWGPDTTRTTVYDDEDDAAIYRAAFDVQDPVSRAPVIPPRPQLSPSNGANNSGGVGGGWNVGSPGNDDDSEVQKGVIASLESSNQQYIEASRRLNNAANSSTTNSPSNAAGSSSSPSKSNVLSNSNKGNNAGVTVGQGSARSYASAAVSKLTKSHSKPSSSSSPNNNNNNNAGPSRPSASSATVAGSNAVVVRNSKPSGSKPSVSGSGGKGTGGGGSGAVPPSMMMGLDADEHLQDQPSFPPLTAPDSPTAGLTSAEARLLQKQEAEDRKSRELAMKLHRQEEQLAERERRQATRRANMNTEYAYDDPAVRDDGSFGGAGIAIPGWNTVSSAVSGAAGMVSNVIGIGGGGSSTRKSGEGSGSGSGGASGSGSAGGSGSGSGGGNRYSVLADSHQNSDGTWTHTRREGNRTIVTTYKMVENHPFASGGRRAQEDEAASLAYATMLQEQENERMMREALEKSRRDSNRVNQYQ